MPHDLRVKLLTMIVLWRSLARHNLWGWLKVVHDRRRLVVLRSATNPQTFGMAHGIEW
jgi:hypothetical protein